MQLKTIDRELDRHYDVPMVKQALFDGFEPIIDRELVLASSQEGFLKDTDHLDKTVLYRRKLDAYLRSSREAGEQVKELFQRHGILFRLYDLEIVVHSPHRIGMAWTILPKKYELIFEFSFEDQNRFDAWPFECRAIEMNEYGVERGDGRAADAKELKTAVLPDWFVEPLKQKQ